MITTLKKPRNVLHLPSVRRPSIETLQAKRRKAMTIIAGFRCKDGVVLTADTEITTDGGTGKTYASKIFSLAPELDCYMAYTGDTDFAEEFSDYLIQNLKGKSSQAALAYIKTAYQEFRAKHYTNAPKDEKTWAWILITLRQGDTIHLYRGRNRHFAEVKRYSVLGIGQDQAEAAFKSLYESWMSIRQAGYVMIYALRKVKGFVQGCGGDSEIREIPDQEDIFSFPPLPYDQHSTKDIEEDFDFFDKTMRPLVLTFADIETTTKDDFKSLLKTFAYALTQRRAIHFKEAEKRKRDNEVAYARILRENP